MAGHPFHEHDLAKLTGPREAFDPGRSENRSVYALQNHLALEVVDHLVQAGVPFSFHGGTALHSKLNTGLRHSTDIDIETTDPDGVHESLKRFADRFAESGVVLEEPPRPLGIPGVRHVLTFPRSADAKDRVPRTVMVEVAEVGALGGRLEPLELRADGFTWPEKAAGPDLEGFFAQKLVTLGPRTVGKPVGHGGHFARQNQGVCKQLFDLTQLLRMHLEFGKIVEQYPDEIRKANAQRKTAFTVREVVEDAAGLLRNLQMPESAVTAEDIVAHALWSGFDSTSRFIGANATWSATIYRTGAGVLDRVLHNIEPPQADWNLVVRPLMGQKVPPPIAAALDEATRMGAVWIPQHRFGGDLSVMWAWSPREHW